MQHIWKALLTSLLIFALAATACLAEDSEAQYQAYSYTTFSLRRTPSESDRGITVRKWSREAPPCHITMVGLHHPLREPDLHLSMYPALLSFGQ